MTGVQRAFKKAAEGIVQLDAGAFTASRLPDRGRNMGTRQLNRLSTVFVNTRRDPGYYCDGGGLYLQVSAQGSKSWIFRYRDLGTRKLRDMGLGSLQTLTLADARISKSDPTSLNRDFVASPPDHANAQPAE